MYYYKEVVDGDIVAVEAKSLPAISPNFEVATETEYNIFMASLPPSSEPKPTPSFETFTHGIPDKVEAIERFLKVVYP